LVRSTVSRAIIKDKNFQCDAKGRGAVSISVGLKLANLRMKLFAEALKFVAADELCWLSAV